MISEFQPRPLSADDCEHLELIATRLGAGRFELAGGTWAFRLEPAVAVPRLPEDARFIEFDWGGARLWLAAPRVLFAVAYEHRFPTTDVSLLPPSLALAAADLAGREVIADLEEISGRRVRLASLGASVPALPRGGDFLFLVSLDSGIAGNGTECWVGVDAPGLAMLALLARRSPPRPATVPDVNLPIEITLALGETCLPAGQLCRLHPGDVLLMDSTYAEGREIRVALCPGDRHRLVARLSGSDLIAETALEKTTMTPPDDAADAAAPLVIDDIEVRLTFDLGRKTMTLGELSALRPGQVLALDAPPARGVFVRTGGQLIGRGEIVQIGEAFGVRLLTVCSGPCQV